ncbi:MAG: LysR family transcriptional regulator [Gammaproteobacteria bacterium]|nr:LysR family transcriptional regulator [Gammaproteobacteria bacterium]
MDDLQAFVRVVEEQGFSAAALRLDTTAAAISRRVKALEQRLGVRLLQRTTRKVQLTEAGEAFYSSVRRILDDLQGAEERARQHAGEVAGELRIAAPMSYGQRVLAPLVAAFARSHPRLRLSLLLEDNETDLVDSGVDLALRISYPMDGSHVARPLLPIPRHLCASPDYLDRRGTPTTPTDLLGHDCLHYNLIREHEEWTFATPEGEQTLSIRGVFCSNNGDALCEAAIQGLGITLLPEFIVAPALAEGRLVRLLAEHERSPLTLFALYPSRHFVPTKVRLLLDFLKQHLVASR